MKNIAVIIAAHKEYRMPTDPMYVPLHVGACNQTAEKKKEAEAAAQLSGSLAHAWDEAYEKDDTGEQISYLNPSFCELTGLYWAWKNLDANFVGLVHYRRHFFLSKKSDPFSSILTERELVQLLPSYDVFVPKKRNYYIETLYSHYAHTHFAVQLDASREIIARLFPEDLPAFDTVVNRTTGYMFNMMILRRDLFNAYCSWLFSILFSLKKELGAKTVEGFEEAEAESGDLPVLSDFQARFYGRVSEILFNVWLERQFETGVIQRTRVRELGYLNLEGENWSRKITSFLKAKFFGRKYDASF